MTEFVWKARGSRAVDAQTVGEHIAEIEAAEGVCHPARLVEDARPKDSPLHEMFEWGDAKAAASWRTAQARSIINSVRVVVENVPRSELPPAFVHVQIETGPGYMSTPRAMSDDAHRAQVVLEALKQMQSLEARYRGLQLFTPVWDALREVEEVVAN